jgi:hypothetical protein
MRSPWIAALLSALAWPGAGQFYNKDFKKGLVLTALTALLGMSLLIGVGGAVLHALPADGSPFDPERIRAVKEAIMTANPRLYGSYSLLLTLTWFFSVVDAFLGARERSAPPPPTA